MSDTMHHVAEAIKRASEFGDEPRIYTGPEAPPPVECKGCGIMVHARDLGELFGWHGKWGLTNLCYDGAVDAEGNEIPPYDCLTKQQRADDDEYAAKDRYKGARILACGLTAAEQAYPMAWLRERMKGCAFPADDVDRSAQTDVPMWRYVHGASGTGVSTQLALAVRHYVEIGKTAVMVTEASLLKGLMPDGGKTIDDFARRWDVLAIDKFGGWRSEYTRECIESIVEERYRRQKPTIFGSLHPLEVAEGHRNGNCQACAARYRVASTDCRYPCIENLPAGGSIGYKIKVACGGWRGICEMKEDLRPMPDMREPSTYQQRTGAQKVRQVHAGRVRTQRRDGDPSPF